MEPSEIAAYIGAAAWIPIAITWIYKRFITPKITLVPDEMPEISFTTLGPIFNLRMAITADRKPAVIDSFSLQLEHQDGEVRTFHWSGMTEDVNQIVDATGNRQKIEKEQTAIAFHIGVESLLEKFVRFQDRSFSDEIRSAIDALEENVYFAMKQNSFSAEESLGSKEYEEVKRIWKREFPWKTGRYTMKFSIGSPTRISVTQPKMFFTLTDTDIEILQRNLEIGNKFREAQLKQIGDGKDMPLFHWQWRNPRLIRPDREQGVADQRPAVVQAKLK